MADVVLTLTQIENIFQDMTTRILGYDPSVAANGDRVRISYQPEGAPGWKRTDDIVFIRVGLVPDLVAQQRDISYSPISQQQSNRKVTYTRVLSVQWILYGPNSFDKADVIRNGLYLPSYRDTLKANNLFMVLDSVQVPTRMPELLNSQWWERVDFSANFNESVTRESKVQNIEVATAGLYTEKGEV